MWQLCVEESRRTTRKVDWEFVRSEVYDIFDKTSNYSNTDWVSSSSLGLDEIIMELPIGSFNEEVLSYDSFCLNNP